MRLLSGYGCSIRYAILLSLASSSRIYRSRSISNGLLPVWTLVVSSDSAGIMYCGVSYSNVIYHPLLFNKKGGCKEALMKTGFRSAFCLALGGIVRIIRNRISQPPPSPSADNSYPLCVFMNTRYSKVHLAVKFNFISDCGKTVSSHVVN
jgi:hypothetical protein